MSLNQNSKFQSTSSEKVVFSHILETTDTSYMLEIFHLRLKPQIALSVENWYNPYVSNGLAYHPGEELSPQGFSNRPFA